VPHFRVTWTIDIFDVYTPEDAAREALRIQRDHDSTATVFEVQSRGVLTAPAGQPLVTIDLAPDEPDEPDEPG
jgi:hypothetical protein